ncbi:class F sortase [Streptomyces sp. NPDC006610]|uniref:class F sortase n=1 Tax=Streptomyces sp. NPDC006610 TaxID=3154584 RepID=UPI0033A70500
MARPPEYRGRPRGRTRAYRLTRTALLALCLVVGGVWWAQDEEPGAATAAPGPAAARAGASAPDRTARPDSPPGVASGQGGSGPASSASPAARMGAAERGPGARADGPDSRAGAGRPRSSPGSGGSGAPPQAGGPGARPGSGRPGAHAQSGGPGARPGAEGPGSHAGAGSRGPRAGSPGPGARTGAAVPRAPARPAPRPLPPSRAARLTVPYLDIDAPVVGIGLDDRRRMTAPPDDDPNLVGWYTGGPTPGENGTAVAVGHLDTMKGPAVFAGLAELRPGRSIEARRSDGRTAVYTVDAVKSYTKEDFPSQLVYGHRGRPELRLITCDGDYDRRSGYSGNLVVFAHLTQIREPGRAPARG